MAVIETWFDQDLKKPVKVQYINGNVFSQDNNGNLIGVNVFDNGETASITGSVSANVVRSDGATVAVSGTLSNNKAYVVLPQSAYAVPGVISIVIKLTIGAVITTLCAVVANVYQSSTDSVVDPGTIIPDISLLIATINEAVAAIPADYSGLMDSLQITSTDSFALSDEKTISSTATGWRLVPETGLCVSNSSYNLVKYSVTSCKTYYVKTDDYFQFQNSSSVPASGTSNRIGLTHAVGGYVIDAPAGSSWLILSTKASGGSYSVKDATFSKGELALKSAYKSTQDNDLDNCPVGYIMLDSGTAYANAPYDTGKVAHVITYGSYLSGDDSSRYLIQYYFTDGDATEVWRRRRSGGTWTTWSKIYDGVGIFRSARVAVADSDLNNCDVGYVFLDYGTVYTNAPYDDNRVSHVITYGSYRAGNDSNRYIVQYYFTDADGKCEVWRRRRSSGTWTGWEKVYEKTAATANMDDTVPDMSLFTRSGNNSQGANTGVNLRVLCYNIANFNDDTSTYIPDENLIELRKMFGKQNAEVLLLQEDREYIDSSNTQSSDSYVYFPMYPNRYGAGGSTIHSKVQLSNAGIVQFSNGRNMRYGVLNVSQSIKILCVSAHPVWGGSTQEYIDARDTQYHEMCQWVNGEITLEPYGGGTGVYAPAHTHVVIGIDTNAGTAQDIANLQTRVSNAGLLMANGGRFGFVYTCNIGSEARRNCIDNIIVSNNIIINNFESLSSLYSSLYSDHVPIIADLTLLS